MTRSPASLPGRLVFAIWLLCCAVLGASYSGNLVAFLTVPPLTREIDAVDDLVRFNRTLTWGVPAGSQLVHILETSENWKNEYVGRQAIRHKEITDEVLYSIRQGRHALIHCRDDLVEIMRNSYATTGAYSYVIGDNIIEMGLALAFVKNYPFLPLIDKTLSYLVKTGLVQKWANDFHPPLNHSSTHDAQLAASFTELSISIYEFQSSIYILGIGAALGTFLFALERVIGARWKKWKLQQRIGDRGRKAQRVLTGPITVYTPYR